MAEHGDARFGFVETRDAARSDRPECLAASPIRSCAIGVSPPSRRRRLCLTPLALAGCAGTLSTVHPAGPAAARIATLWWVMLAGAAAIFALVMALLASAYRQAPVARPTRAPTRARLDRRARPRLSARGAGRAAGLRPGDRGSAAAAPRRRCRDGAGARRGNGPGASATPTLPGRETRGRAAHSRRATGRRRDHQRST